MIRTTRTTKWPMAKHSRRVRTGYSRTNRDFFGNQRTHWICEKALQLYGSSNWNSFQPTTNLVDSASSHMLVSRIKPCKPKSNWIKRRSANGSLYQWFSTGRIAGNTASWITLRNAMLIHVKTWFLLSNCLGETLGRARASRIVGIKTNASNGSVLKRWIKLFSISVH